MRLPLLLAALPLCPALAADPAVRPEVFESCVSCHGRDGIGTAPMFPDLAGKTPEALAKALGDYRSEARTHEVMTEQAKALTAAEVAALAAYYGGLK